MKKILSLVLCVLLVAVSFPFGTFPVSAAAKTEDGFTYVIIGNSSVEITRYTGDSETVVVPSEIAGYPVTRLHSMSFRNCETVEYVYIRDGVTAINSSAFANCENLVSVVLPETLTYMGTGAFSGCYDLSDIIIPDGLTSIGANTFSGCISLKSVVLPEELTHIDYNAFLNCSRLTDITIPSSLMELGSKAFGGCTKLEEITLPKDLTNIAPSAFDESGLYNNVSNWENGIFYVGNTLITAKDSIEEELSVRNGTVSIADNAFYGNTSLSILNIPESVEVIGEQAFKGCGNLSEIYVTPSLVSLGAGAFDGCNKIQKIYFSGTEEQWELCPLSTCEDLVGAAVSYGTGNVYSPYSGGSGTEDDPYLISTERDIRNLRKNIINDSSLWKEKYYYKLTNDIETDEAFSPLYMTDEYEWNAFVEYGYGKDTGVPVYKVYELWYISMEGQYGDILSDVFEFQEDIDDYDHPLFGGGYDLFPGMREYLRTRGRYRNAAFTGVLDGNGHTVKYTGDGYLFGFVENGALIKDLTIEGEDASFAYCVDQTSMLMNCNFKNLADDKGIEYNYGIEIDGITNDGIAYTVTDDLGIHIKALFEHGDDVVIPETINGMTVTGIDERAFSSKKIEINSLYIPGEISWIASNAFISDWHSAVIGTIYFDGTEKEFGNVFDGGYSGSVYRTFKNYYEIIFNPIRVEGIVLSGGEESITLDVGETFVANHEVYPENANGIVTFSTNNSCVSISGKTIKGVKAGEATVTMTAESGVKYSFKVKVIGCVGIEVARLPDKVNYSTRQPFDITGIVINKLYNDGTTKETTSYTYSGYNALKKGVQTITVTAGSYTTQFEIYSSDAVVGDIDLDGTISSIDSNYMRRTVSGAISPEVKTDEFFVCDLNGDGMINAIDSALLRRKIAG